MERFIILSLLVLVSGVACRGKTRQEDDVDSDSKRNNAKQGSRGRFVMATRGLGKTMPEGSAVQPPQEDKKSPDGPLDLRPRITDLTKKGPDVVMSRLLHVAWKRNILLQNENRLIIRAHRWDPRRCYDQYLKAVAKPPKELSIVVFIQIGSDGRVEYVDTGAGKGAENMLRQCIKKSMKKWRFTKQPQSMLFVTEYRMSPYLYFRPSCGIVFGGSCADWKQRWYGQQ